MLLRDKSQLTSSNSEATVLVSYSKLNLVIVKTPEIIVQSQEFTSMFYHRFLVSQLFKFNQRQKC